MDLKEFVASLPKSARNELALALAAVENDEAKRMIEENWKQIKWQLNDIVDSENFNENTFRVDLTMHFNRTHQNGLRFSKMAVDRFYDQN